MKYCRHCAAWLYLRRWAGQWYLEINPTCHFTIDGRRDSYYDAEYVAKIKRMERNGAVYQLVRVGGLPARRGHPVQEQGRADLVWQPTSDRRRRRDR